MLSPNIASLHLSTRNPILSSAWAGPSIRMDEHEYRTYKLLQETVKQQEADKRHAEKERQRAGEFFFLVFWNFFLGGGKNVNG